MLRALRSKPGSATIMQIWEVLDSQVKRADAKIKQLDRAKNREETGSDSESSKGFSAELRRDH